MQYWFPICGYRYGWCTKNPDFPCPSDRFGGTIGKYLSCYWSRLSHPATGNKPSTKARKVK